MLIIRAKVDPVSSGPEPVANGPSSAQLQACDVRAADNGEVTPGEEVSLPTQGAVPPLLCAGARQVLCQRGPLGMRPRP